jgi:drug/metabolite transporter (DMT)-like permease
VLSDSWNWPVPNAEQCVYLVLIGLLGTAAQFLMTAAFRYAEASVVAPTEYTGIITATLLGYVFFGEMPGTSIWMGAPLVIVAGLLIIWSQYPAANAPRTRKGAPPVCAPRTPGR